MSCPPFGERTKHSEWTYSHFDSHTMGNHESEILGHPNSPRPLWEDEPLSTYGTLSGSGHHSIGMLHKYLSHYTDRAHTHYRYWLLGDETHHAPISTNTIRYGMPDVLETSS